jgi:KDO2-lipid IV(A) lauroyltransferase
MPISFNLWLGQSLGAFAYYASGKRSRITYANLKAAFCREKSPREIKRLTKEVYKHAGRTFAEILSITKVDQRYVDKYIEDVNRKHIEEAARNPNGMMLVSAHYGNWELLTVVSVFRGFPLHLLARDQKMSRLNELLNTLRESKGNIVIRKGMDIKNIFRILRSGGGVGILADQNAGPNGELLDFFGRPASTAVGPYKFAQKSGAWVLPAFMHRKKGPYHKIVIEEPMIIKKGEDVVPYMKEYNRLLEKHVRDHPEQWFWMHKKWKLTPVKRILVLDDSKKGHLKQALAAVKQLKYYREKEGFSPDETQVDIVGVKFKSKTARALFKSLNPLFIFKCQGRLDRLKWVLKRDCYEDLAGRYADVVISCGSTLSGLNRMMKTENNARNLTVLDPGRFNRRKFDLVVVPRHDVSAKGIKGENVIVTDLAPNTIEPEKIGSLRKEVDSELSFQGSVRIGMLVGGENPGFSFGKDLARSLASGVKEACEKLNGYLYMTTSRRTPGPAETVMKDSLGDYRRCVRFVSGKEDQDALTVEKILSFSDVVVVSGESISMVSEAVSSGKPVLVFMPDKKSKRAAKYEKFVKLLQDKKYLKLISPDGIREGAELYLSGRQERVLPEDGKRIREKMYRLF